MTRWNPIKTSAAIGALGLSFLIACSATAQSTVRTVSGVITDTHHEPLRDAIVELQNSANESVTSYLTQSDGHYIFKRIDGNADYLIWVTWRGHKSKTRPISKFDDHMNKVIDFTVEPY